MRNLADEQIDFIRDDIRRRGVFTESLQEDLLDHLCCYIETQPEDERPFGELYRQALEAFGHNGLQQVQDETLYLINNRYLTTMKKLMYISGAAASLMLLAGAFFKIQHWPGASILLVVGTLALVLFFPFFFYFNFKEQTEKKGKIISAIGLATAIMLCLGALFKIMHWPGAIVMIGGFALFFVIFLPLYIINGVRNPLTRFSSLSNGFLFACIGGFMMLLSFQQPSMAVMDSFAKIHQDQEQLCSTLADEWKTKAAQHPPACTSAFDEFSKSCTDALLQLPGSDQSEPVGTGPAVKPEALTQLQATLDSAVDRLNDKMRDGCGQDSHWKPLGKIRLQPGQLGNVRFQVLQLECRAYSQALAM